MKILIIISMILLSLSTFANDQLESIAKSATLDFLLSIQKNSGGINIKSNWDGLKEKMSKNASQELVSSILNNQSEDSFNDSLIKIMTITSSAQTMTLLSSVPQVVDVTEFSGETKFIMKPFEADDVELYEITCSKKIVKGLFGKTMKDTCKVTGVTF